MEQVAFFDTKPYDREWFDKLNTDFKFKYHEHKLTADSAVYTALANDLSLLDEEYFDMRGCTFPTV